MKKIPFDISFKDKIERGEVKVVTRDDREVTIIKWDLKGNYPIVACFKVEVCNYEGDESWFEERPFAFSKEGKLSNGFPGNKSDIFILVEEPVSEGLEEATNNYCVNVRRGYPRVMDETDRYICNAFKAGANWQKQQMKKEAIDGQLENGEDYLRIKCLSMGCQPQDDGKLVKLIIIKED